MKKQSKTEHKLIEEKASDIVQKTAETAGTLQTLDYLIEEMGDKIPDNIIWTIRHAYRTIESVTEDATAIHEISEQMRKEAKHVQ
ncbi:MAG: hypothetical protein L3J47_09955 [Sulfurovum sp.]|nr:hypothetical protein [Sulfurovum sp.]